MTAWLGKVIDRLIRASDFWLRDTPAQTLSQLIRLQQKKVRGLHKKNQSSSVAEFSIVWKEGWTSQTKNTLTVWLLLSKLLVRHRVAKCGRVFGGKWSVRGGSFYLAVGSVIISLNRFARWSVSIDRLPALEKVLFFMVFLFRASFLHILGVLIKTSSRNWSMRCFGTSVSKTFNQEEHKKLLISINRSCQF